MLNLDNKGMASIESIALITIFVTLVSYALGMFGVIHSGILNSIAARTYAWETYSHRTNLTFFRDNRTAAAARQHYKSFGFRAHTIGSEKSPRSQSSPEFWATERLVSIVPPDEFQGRSSGAHLQLRNIASNRERVSVNPVWIRTVYGICLNSKCGD